MNTGLRFRVFMRDGFTCVYCGRKPPKAILVIDHRNPRCAGGPHTKDNLVTSCRECNRGKSDILLESGKRAISLYRKSKSTPRGESHLPVKHQTIDGWREELECMAAIVSRDSGLEVSFRIRNKTAGSEVGVANA